MKKFGVLIILFVNFLLFVSCDKCISSTKEITSLSETTISTDETTEEIVHNSETSDENSVQKNEVYFESNDEGLVMEIESLSSEMILNNEEEFKNFFNDDSVMAEYCYNCWMAPNTQDITDKHYFVFEQKWENGADDYVMYVRWDEYDYKGKYMCSGSTKGIVLSRYVGYIDFWSYDITGDLNYEIMVVVNDLDADKEKVLVFTPDINKGWEYMGCYDANDVDSEYFFDIQFNSYW